MSTKPNTNLNAVELTQSELHSVTGGSTSSAQQAQQSHHAHDALANAMRRLAQSSQSHKSNHKGI